MDLGKLGVTLTAEDSRYRKVLGVAVREIKGAEREIKGSADRIGRAASGDKWGLGFLKMQLAIKATKFVFREAVENSSALNTEWDRLSKSGGVLAGALGTKLAPAFKQLADLGERIAAKVTGQAPGAQDKTEEQQLKETRARNAIMHFRQSPSQLERGGAGAVDYWSKVGESLETADQQRKQLAAGNTGGIDTQRALNKHGVRSAAFAEQQLLKARGLHGRLPGTVMADLALASAPDKRGLGASQVPGRANLGAVDPRTAQYLARFGMAPAPQRASGKLSLEEGGEVDPYGLAEAKAFGALRPHTRARSGFIGVSGSDREGQRHAELLQEIRDGIDRLGRDGVPATVR